MVARSALGFAAGGHAAHGQARTPGFNALVYGKLTPRQLVEEVPPSQRVKTWIARIECSADRAATRRDVGGCTLRAHGPFGVREVQETHAKGHPANPITDD